MLANIVLDQHFSHYTNLDVISGKVFVQTQTATTVSSIVVKLEGESRTRLLPPPNPSNDRQKPQLEFHKILYKVQAVFPPPDVTGQQGAAASLSGKTAYTLPAGQHEYPFTFKVPFNNACDPSSNSNPTISLFGGLNVEMYKTPHSHVRKTLPPTLVGFPGQADIRYYVKATVNRPSLFKENVRAYLPFNFCPIEPPRPPPSDAQGYARRKHQFNSHLATTLTTAGPTRSKMSSFFGGGGGSKKNSEATSATAPPPTAPFIALDMRIPEPAILTCGRPVPARLIVTSLNGATSRLTLVNLQLEVVHLTKIRAQEVGRMERSSTVLFSRSGMMVPLLFEKNAAPGSKTREPEEVKAEIDSRLWSDMALPNVVPPSFETCNITRSYEIFARVGIRWDDAVGSTKNQPQITTLDLRLPVQIFSGITPPPQLLEAMAAATAAQASNPSHHQTPPAMPPRPNYPRDTKTPSGAPALPLRKPIASTVTAEPVHVQPPPPPAFQQQHATATAAGEQEELLFGGDAPPSYDDAMGTDIQLPADGIHRADYAPPVVAEDALLNSGIGGEKSGWH